MKRILSLSILVLAASSAWAQSADTAIITQIESVGSTAVIEQLATQGGNIAQVTQERVDGSLVRLNQSGQMNDVTVRQYEGQNLIAFVGTRTSWDGAPGGDSNTVLIEQSGIDSAAFVDSDRGSAYNRVEVFQRGWGGGQNQVEISHYNSSGNLASVYQNGSNLTGVITQAGGGHNAATIRQGF